MTLDHRIGIIFIEVISNHRTKRLATESRLTRQELGDCRNPFAFDKFKVLVLEDIIQYSMAAVHGEISLNINPSTGPRRTAVQVVLRNLGIIRILLGSSSCVIGVLLLTLVDWLKDFGYGMWGGALIIVGGVICIISATNPYNRCQNVANMVVAIISCVADLGQIVFFSMIIVLHNDRARLCDEPLHSSRICKPHNRNSVYMFYAFILLMAADFIIALISAVFSCKLAKCCCSHCASEPDNVTFIAM